MEKIWLRSYPPGVPAEIDVGAYRSIGDLFEQSVRRFASHPAYVCMGKAITYAELEQQSRQFAAYLQQGLKLQRGSRVALMMPNLLQYPIALFGALRAGYTIVNVNPLYPANSSINLPMPGSRRLSSWRTLHTPCSRFAAACRCATSSLRAWGRCWIFPSARSSISLSVM